MPKQLFVAAAVAAVFGLAACGSETGSDPGAAEESTGESLVESGECEQVPRAQAQDPVEAVAVLYPDDFAFRDESGFHYPGYASVNVARGGKVIAAVELERRAKGMWRVTCVTESEFSAKYDPVPK